MHVAQIEVSSHCAGALANSAKREMQEAERVLGLLRRIVAGDMATGPLRCYLPPTLANLPIDELQENIDPWCSLVVFWRDWYEKFDAIAKVDRTNTHARQ